MKYCYEKLELLPPDATFYDHTADEDFPLDFSELIDASQAPEADMEPLSTEAINGHLLGKAMLGTSWSPRGIAHRDVLAYAGITGVTEHNNTKLAVVGGVITHPTAHNVGFGFLTVNALLGAASTWKSRSELEHQGYLALCNPASLPLFKKLGFTAAGPSQGKELMLKHF